MSGKRFTEAKKLVESKKLYPIEEASALVKKTATAKFNEAVEIHMRLGIDPSKSDQQVRGTISLPHGTGKSKRVAAFVEAAKEAEAKTAGADIVGGEELINEISQKNIIDFDVAIATPAMMPKLSKLAKFLGPKGLMPNPKSGTVTDDLAKAKAEFASGRVEYKQDKGNVIHLAIGKVSFDSDAILANLNVLLATLPVPKIDSIILSSTMGPGIKVRL